MDAETQHTHTQTLEYVCIKRHCSLLIIPPLLPPPHPLAPVAHKCKIRLQLDDAKPQNHS